MKELLYSGKSDNTSLCNKALAILEQQTKIKPIHCVFMTDTAFKTFSQNRVFHSLLECFWKSGCSSFNSYEELRRHYKIIGGLVKVIDKPMNIDKMYKSMIAKALKLLPMPEQVYNEVIATLKGKVVSEGSWSDIKKDDATKVIDCLLNDMDSAGVISSSQGNKYEQILNGLHERK